MLKKWKLEQLDESELEQTVELSCVAFDPDGHQRYWQYIKGDSSYRPSQTRVVVVNDRGCRDLTGLGTENAGRCIPRNNGWHRWGLYASELPWCRICVCPHARHY